MSQPLLALIPPDTDERPYENLLDVARSIHQHLLRQGVISRQALQKLMTQRFGGTDASGAWSMRDAYEALEAAQVLLLREDDCRHLSGATPQDRFQSLLTLERSLPTQTYRSERQVDLQQFSTPLTLAWLAGLAAAIDKTDCVLVPSAGTGLLAVHAARAGASLILNERDPQRAALLGDMFGQTVTDHDGELIDDLLPQTARPTVILINPPFSRSASRGHDRHAGARHLRSSLLRLQPGGRCVAIMSPGFARANTGGPGYEAVCEIATPRVEIDIEGSPYVKHGTSINVRLLVFDKGWSGVTEHHRAPDLAGALPLVLALPPHLSLDQPPPAPTAAAITPRLPIRTAPSGLLRGLAAKALTAPIPKAPSPSPVFPLGKPITMPSGILFCTYATLRSQRYDEASRLQQILDWLREDFDGIIVIDEAHALANAAGTETQFGAAKGSEQGLAGVRLQNALPRARILYLSATGATDPANLCYATRLGLWGPGTAFPDRNAFMAAMDEGGIAAMEIVARDLKAMGLYTARALSFAGVEYEALEHQLTADQIDIYDAFADSWAILCAAAHKTCYREVAIM
ncbi:methylase [Novosphingobium sp. NBM11]|uniref:strawberry notch family protein n=1 Tax=Novosphingobium sp. NBM11 TaxID=2596914 RepID=UPI0018928064|nr:strawberry notch family protein [Novosphingobium sp. NBM11]MBF5089098.1 methylase [Novosphingobium sp. NBM11]